MNLQISPLRADGRAARAQQATRYYWLTQDHNASARALYDKVAQFSRTRRPTRDETCSAWAANTA